MKWDAPAANTTPITRYDVRYSKGNSGDPTIKVSPGTDTSTTIDGLDNGQPYDVQVRAISEAGSGGWSDSTTGTPVAQKPDAPNPPRLIPGNGQLEVEWTKPAENGAPITELQRAVQARATRGVGTIKVSSGTPTLSTTIDQPQERSVSTRCRCRRSAWPATATGRTAHEGTPVAQTALHAPTRR